MGCSSWVLAPSITNWSDHDAEHWNFLVSISNKGRISFIFWIKCSAEGLCWYLRSLTIGNLYIYLEWSGKNDVSRAEINRLFTGLSILCAIGGVLFLFLKAPFCQYEAPKHLSKEPEDGYWNYFRKNLDCEFYFHNHSKSKTNPSWRNHRNWLQSVSLLRKTCRL